MTIWKIADGVFVGSTLKARVRSLLKFSKF
jgi:predicted TIM-barrel enzyme